MKYYAVSCGKVPGIYTKWDEAKGMVNGWPGAKYKSFNTYDEASAYMKTGSTNTKYYAVINGRNTGIYNDWNVAKMQIDGWKCPIYKSFTTYENAKEFMNKSTFSRIAPKNINIAYTDGSYSKGEGGYGIVIINTMGEKYIKYGKVPGKCTNNVAELYAIYILLVTIEGDIKIHTDSTYVVSTLSSYIHDIVWSDDIINKEILRDIYILMKDRNVYFVHVDAHVGIELNEEADYLANLGRNIITY